MTTHATQGDHRALRRAGASVIDLRLKVAALQRAEKDVADALGVAIGDCSPAPAGQRYANLFRDMDLLLRRVETGPTRLAPASPHQLQEEVTALQEAAAQMVRAWLFEAVPSGELPGTTGSR